SFLNENGQIMIGNKAFEFYNSKDVRKYIQIPWNEINLVTANVFFKGKWISRFAIQTKSDGTFQFSSKETKMVLRTMQAYVPADKMLQADSFFKNIKRGIMSLGKNK
ncbi:MAG TPA: DUF956 family protein, partial [Tetragenococcus sp.]|nr:DUF956 family protein [Tetragenococcus sp.]